MGETRTVVTWLGWAWAFFCFVLLFYRSTSYVVLLRRTISRRQWMKAFAAYGRTTSCPQCAMDPQTAYDLRAIVAKGALFKLPLYVGHVSSASGDFTTCLLRPMDATSQQCE
ncbi:unnamed protein product, partial [Hapterophycus canaliculatus]